MNISSGIASIQLSPAHNSRKVYFHARYNTKPIRRVEKLAERRMPVLPESSIGKVARERMNGGSAGRLYTLNGTPMRNPLVSGHNIDLYA